MKKIIILSLLIFFVSSMTLSAQEDAILKGLKIKGGFPFYVYTDSFNRLNHYIPSGWMGDYGDIKYNDRWNQNPMSGKTCIQIKYTAERKQGAGWSGVYWQNPANNWGTSKGGYDLTGAKKLFFNARGEKGDELVEFKVGGITGQYSDTAGGTTGPVELSKEWKMFEIDLTDMDMSFINGGFCVVFSGDANPDGCTFYIDEIYYTDKTTPLKDDKSSKKDDKSSKGKK
ncbi:MAG: hypothetical protein PHF84_05705 [bacterium]|nr:hypothetical protein [bacterium]